MTRGMVLALVVGAPACGRPLEREECLRLLDRYTERLVVEEDPEATPERVAHLQDDARTRARLDDRFQLSTCKDRVSRSSFDCAMNAPTVDAIERCLVF